MGNTIKSQPSDSGHIGMEQAQKQQVSQQQLQPRRSIWGRMLKTTGIVMLGLVLSAPPLFSAGKGKASPKEGVKVAQATVKPKDGIKVAQNIIPSRAIPKAERIMDCESLTKEKKDFQMGSLTCDFKVKTGPTCDKVKFYCSGGDATVIFDKIFPGRSFIPTNVLILKNDIVTMGTINETSNYTEGPRYYAYTITIPTSDDIITQPVLTSAPVDKVKLTFEEKDGKLIVKHSSKQTSSSCNITYDEQGKVLDPTKEEEACFQKLEAITASNNY